MKVRGPRRCDDPQYDAMITSHQALCCMLPVCLMGLTITSKTQVDETGSGFLL